MDEEELEAGLRQLATDLRDGTWHGGLARAAHGSEDKRRAAALDEKQTSVTASCAGGDGDNRVRRPEHQ
jgi:hypothetical protein